MVCAQVPEVYISSYMYAPSPHLDLLVFTGLDTCIRFIVGESIVLYACHHLVVVFHSVSLVATLSFVSVTDAHITEKFGIIVVNWPLAQFIAPGSINSRLELQTLYNAWSTGATYFQCLTPAEAEAWHKERFSRQVAAAVSTVTETLPDASVGGDQVSSTDNPVPEPGTPTDNAGPSNALPASGDASAPPPPLGSASDQQTTSIAQTGVFAVSGATLVTKKPRKQRSDKGKKRGPRTAE
ncbi:hypothetical protein BC835DRAFT_1420231 [Cytidiella melzeri]|nr:hypothetical protein BC835DRAFT_1420231 [Cytidiella melzeri]